MFEEMRVRTILDWWRAMVLKVSVGQFSSVPISHGEGRFLASDELIAKLAANGQIATQYVDLDGNASNDIHFNPNDSVCAIEGITSPDGRVFGKMGHTERIGKELEKARNGLRITENKLKNEKFVANAPEAVVNAEREKAAKYSELIAKLEESARAMQG